MKNIKMGLALVFGLLAFSSSFAYCNGPNPNCLFLRTITVWNKTNFNDLYTTTNNYCSCCADRPFITDNFHPGKHLTGPIL